MKKLVIAGNGGFAREVEWLVERINKEKPTWDFLGFIDNSENDGASSSNIIGNDEFVTAYEAELYVAIAIGNPETRKKVYEKYKKNSLICFANLIDPSVISSDKNSFGQGNIICAGTILTVNIVIGNFNIINLDCTVGHEAVIGDFVTLNPSVNISGNVTICSGVNVGTGTHVIQGLKIEHNSIIGAGAVVNKDMPPFCTAVGVPVKVIKTRTEATDATDTKDLTEIANTQEVAAS